MKDHLDIEYQLLYTDELLESRPPLIANIGENDTPLVNQKLVDALRQAFPIRQHSPGTSTADVLWYEQGQQAVINYVNDILNNNTNV